MSLSFSTAITSLKSHLSLHLRAKSCNFPIAAAIRNPTEIVLFSHDWISKRIFWQIEFSLSPSLLRREAALGVVWTASKSRTSESE